VPTAPPIIAALFAWLHLLAIGIGGGLLLTEYWLCRRMLDRQQVKLLGQVDLGYQLALIGSLATGLARALYYGQDAQAYLANRLFWLKIAIFLMIVAIAIPPTLQYIRWNREARTAPAFAPLTREVERVRSGLALGLGLWLILPLIGTLVARGYGI
jgi:putative membrane protein